jgi:hypothetical protein
MGCCNQDNNEKLICYCFNITENAFLQALKDNNGGTLMDFVIFQTKNDYCNCEQLNPSKTCCLKDFKKLTRPTSDN